MNIICSENQKKIDSYINGSLGGDELKKFVNHVKGCNECMEELKINYSLLKALDQLEKGDELSEDFDAELEKGIDEYLGKQRRGYILKVISYVSAFIISMAFGIVFSIFFFRHEGIDFLEKGKEETFMIDFDGVPDFMNDVKKMNNDYNDNLIEYIHSLKLEDERQESADE